MRRSRFGDEIKKSIKDKVYKKRNSQILQIQTQKMKKKKTQLTTA